MYENQKEVTDGLEKFFELCEAPRRRTRILVSLFSRDPELFHGLLLFGVDPQRADEFMEKVVERVGVLKRISPDFDVFAKRGSTVIAKGNATSGELRFRDRETADIRGFRFEGVRADLVRELCAAVLEWIKTQRPREAVGA